MRLRKKSLSLAKQLLPQGSLSVFMLVDPAFLQDGHDEIDEILEGLRRDHPTEIETVNPRLLDPGLQFVGNLLSRAEQRRVAGSQSLSKILRKVQTCELSRVNASSIEVMASVFMYWSGSSRSYL